MVAGESKENEIEERERPGLFKGRLNKLSRDLTLSYRKRTWRKRKLPDFVIIGAMRSGTSSLFAYLSQHPQIYPAYKKEIHYFSGGMTRKIDNFAYGSAWYRAHFPLAAEMPATSKTFEATPMYIFHPLVAERMAGQVPDTRLVAVLRSPTERAISHYFLEKSRGRESLPLYEALQAEEERLAPALAAHDYKDREFIHHSYKSRGLYKEQLDRFLAYYPRSQIKLVSSEELFSTPAPALKSLFEFLEIDSTYQVSDLNPRNAAQRTDVDARVYDYLDDYFRPHNEALYELAGKDFGW